MNITLFLPVILLAPALSAATEPVSVIEKAKQQISREFKYEPPVMSAELEAAAPDENVFLLPAYTVSEWRLRRDVERTMIKAKQEREEKQFDWKNGGTIKEVKLGGRTIEVGVWPDGTSLKLLQIKW